MPVVLIVTVDETLRRALGGFLRRHRCQVVEASTLADAQRRIQSCEVSLAVLEASLSPGRWEGIELARAIRVRHRQIPLILVTRHGSEELAVAALRAGVNDYFNVTASLAELAASVGRHLWEASPRGAPCPTGVPPVELLGGERMIGDSIAIRGVKAYIAKIAATDSNILITGETGTGKELVAELVHRNSPRRGGPFVCVNCAAMPDSLVESELFGYERGAFTGAERPREGRLMLGDGGSVFLDEIGDMSPYAQAKVLRVIETKEIDRLGRGRHVLVDIRVMAASNQDLEQLMTAGRFRQDLYFRLNVARIHLPPLRERKEDVPALLSHYAATMNQRFHLAVEGFSPEALECLVRYDWPGNVRELRNLVEAIFVTCPFGRISMAQLPDRFRRGAVSLENAEQDRLLAALVSADWNKSKAAKALRWSRMTVYRKIAKYHLAGSRGETEPCGAGARTPM